MASPRDAAALMRAAERLGRAARGRKPCALPPLLVLTDPARTPDPIALAERLPHGCGLIYRAFGTPGALETARHLAAVTRRRGVLFLVGADEDLARACGAAGMHLPERLTMRAPAIRARWPGAILTGAAHGGAALRRAASARLDAVLLSKAFPSASPSPGAPLGAVRFAALSRRAATPVYALGGMDASRAPRLRLSAAYGMAVIDALSHRDTISCGSMAQDPPHSADTA